MCTITWVNQSQSHKQCAVHTSLREVSSRRKSKTLFGGTGSQKEVAALSTMPGGLPGSSTLFLVMTRTSSAPLPDSVVHWCAADAVTPPQKLATIRSASFSMLFLPSMLVITAVSRVHTDVYTKLVTINDLYWLELGMCTYHQGHRWGCCWPWRWRGAHIVGPGCRPTVSHRMQALNSPKACRDCALTCHPPQHAPPRSPACTRTQTDINFYTYIARKHVLNMCAFKKKNLLPLHLVD